MSTANQIFVCGSMCEGFVHFSRIQNFIVQQQPATVQGTAYRLKVGYPVLLDEGFDCIPGYLVELQHNELLLQLLEQFHGYNALDSKKSLHFKTEKTVTLQNGEQVQAQVYVLNPAKLPSTATRIEGGDWRRSLSEKPAFTEKLTERQRTYIQRLGASTGREIVPIDLILYRELMNLEMIVDKGRRLALSKFGHEVYRYLE